jgi:hypothetical protein
MRMMDRTTRTIVDWYDRAGAETLNRDMTMPTSWDPYFQPWMTAAQSSPGHASTTVITGRSSVFLHCRHE